MKARWFQLAALAVIAVLAVALYSAKSEAMQSRARVDRLKAEIAAARSDLQALEAEVAMLESPARLEALAREFLALEPGAAARAQNLAALPDYARARTGDNLLGQPEARR